MWRQSKADPRKVYDSRHETVCVAQNAEQAALIIRAVNALPVGDSETFIRLREPALSPQFYPPVISSYVQSFNTFDPDECCTKALSRAPLKDLTSWECPGCGATWTPAEHGTVRHWTATPAVMIFR